METMDERHVRAAPAESVGQRFKSQVQTETIGSSEPMSPAECRQEWKSDRVDFQKSASSSTVGAKTIDVTYVIFNYHLFCFDLRGRTFPMPNVLFIARRDATVYSATAQRHETNLKVQIE